MPPLRAHRSRVRPLTWPMAAPRRRCRSSRPRRGILRSVSTPSSTRGARHLALGQTYEAARFATPVQASASSSALADAAGWLAVDAAVAAGDRPAEFNALSQSTARQTAPSAATTLRLLKAAVAVSDRDAATRAFHTLYYSQAGRSGDGRCASPP